MCNNSDKILIKTPKIPQVTTWRTLLSFLIILIVTKDLNTLPEYCHSPKDYNKYHVCNYSDKIMINTPNIPKITTWRTTLAFLIILMVIKRPEYTS